MFVFVGNLMINCQFRFFSFKRSSKVKSLDATKTHLMRKRMEHFYHM